MSLIWNQDSIITIANIKRKLISSLSKACIFSSSQCPHPKNHAFSERMLMHINYLTVQSLRCKTHAGYHTGGQYQLFPRSLFSLPLGLPMLCFLEWCRTYLHPVHMRWGRSDTCNLPEKKKKRLKRKKQRYPPQICETVWKDYHLPYHLITVFTTVASFSFLWENM